MFSFVFVSHTKQLEILYRSECFLAKYHQTLVNITSASSYSNMGLQEALSINRAILESRVSLHITTPSPTQNIPQWQKHINRTRIYLSPHTNYKKKTQLNETGAWETCF